jgi:hypothetical protein
LLPGASRHFAWQNDGVVCINYRRLKTADGIEVWPLDFLLEKLADGRLWP